MSQVLVVLLAIAACIEASPFKYLRSSSTFSKSHELTSLSHHTHHGKTAAAHKHQYRKLEEVHDFEVDDDSVVRDPKALRDSVKLSQDWISTHVYESSSGKMGRPNNVFHFRPSGDGDHGYLKGREDLDREYRFEESPFKLQQLRLRDPRFDGMKCTGLLTCSCIHYFFRIPEDNVVLQASYHANAGDIIREGRPVQLIDDPAFAKATRANTFVVVQVGPASEVRIESGNIYKDADVFTLVEKAKIPLDNIYVITGDSMHLSFADKDGFVSQLPPRMQQQQQVAAAPKKKKGFLDRFIEHITCSKNMPDCD